MTTIYLLVYMVVGGKSRLIGPIVGAVVLSLVTEFTRPMQEYQPMIIGAIAITVVMLLPEGLVSIPEKVGKRLQRPADHAGRVKLESFPQEGSKNGLS